jgi:hypothetical protein
VKLKALAQIGMLECWNNGIMGSMITGKWPAGKIRDSWGAIKLMDLKLLLKINIPLFHYSIIPCAMQKLKSHGFLSVLKK